MMDTLRFPFSFLLFISLVFTFQFVTAINDPQQKQSPNLPIFNVLVTGFGPFLNYTDNPSGDIAVALNGSCIQFDDLLVDKGVPQQDSFIVCFEGWVLPVNETGATTVSDYLLKETSSPNLSDWAAIVHLGLENSSLGLKIETVGANILADNSSLPAVPGAPSIQPTTADLSLLSIPELLYLPFTSELISIHDEQIISNQGSTITSPVKGSLGQQKATLQKAIKKTKLTDPETEEIGEELWSRDAGTYYCNETFFRTVNTVRTNEIQVSPQACSFTASGKITGNRKRKVTQIAQSCWSTPPVGMVPVEFVHVPDPSNVELETAIQLVARVAAFLVLPNALTI